MFNRQDIIVQKLIVKIKNIKNDYYGSINFLLLHVLLVWLIYLCET